MLQCFRSTDDAGPVFRPNFLLQDESFRPSLCFDDADRPHKRTRTCRVAAVAGASHAVEERVSIALFRWSQSFWVRGERAASTTCPSLWLRQPHTAIPQTFPATKQLASWSMTTHCGRGQPVSPYKLLAFSEYIGLYRPGSSYSYVSIEHQADGTALLLWIRHRDAHSCDVVALFTS